MKYYTLTCFKAFQNVYKNDFANNVCTTCTLNKYNYNKDASP